MSGTTSVTAAPPVTTPPAEAPVTPVATPVEPTQPVDPNAGYHNHIPAAVRRASARADEIHRQATGVVGASPAAPASPAPASVSAPSPEPSQPLAAPSAPVNWEQRYNTLRGKYDAEVPKLSQQAYSLNQTIAVLQQQNQNLIEQLQARPEPGAPAQPAAASFEPTKEQLETWGPELVEFVKAIASSAAKPDLEQIRAAQEQIQQRTAAQAQNSARQSVEFYMDAHASGWREQNFDSNFLAWLELPDMLSGVPRKQLLGDAVAKGDGPRVLAIFRGWSDEHTAPAPVPEPAPIPEPPAGMGLAQFAAPGRGAPMTAGGGAPAPQRRWTTAQIKAFYTDKAKGRYARNPAQAEAIERDIHRAAGEGRVDP